MANDRMWLVHKPTGRKTLLAKNWGYQWEAWRGPCQISLEELFANDDEPASTAYELEFESKS
jgi:hypothetical protein